MRVGLFAEWNPDAPGGVATTLAGLLDHLPHDIRIIPCFNRPGLTTLLRVSEVVRSFKTHHVELVHIAAAGPLALTALCVAARLRLPVVGSFNTDFLTATPIRRRYLRTLADLCDKVLVSSSCGREAMAGYTVPEKVAQWRPGVDVEMFAPKKRSTSLRERWQVSESRPAVIYAGTICEERGASRLLSLELELRRTRPMHRLIVAGDGPALAELQYRCSDAIFLGVVPRVNMPEVLASADLFVSPSERESTHHAVLEAQASGLPVVAMGRGAGRERVADATALVCRSDADFIVHAATLVRTNARRAAMGLAARAHAIDQRWESGLAPLFAEYRIASDTRRSVPRKLVGVVREHRINS
jgi:glycosyltransferase involved in cell wall biosynthesis